MRRWLAWIAVVGVLLGVEPPDFSQSPHHPTVSHEQPAIPAHPEHGADQGVNPGPPAEEMLRLHVASATVSNASAVVGSTLKFEAMVDSMPRQDQPPLMSIPRAHPDLPLVVTVVGLSFLLLFGTFVLTRFRPFPF